MAFNPQKIPTSDYPHPTGTVMRGSMGNMSTVIDRNGFVFLACCPDHEAEGRASGYHPQTDAGRLLDRSEPAGVTSYTCLN